MLIGIILRRILAGTLVFFALIVTSVSRGHAESVSGGATLHIGVILSLSGAFADYGVAIKNGIDLALEEQPRARERFKFLYEDSQYDPKQAVPAFLKLVTREKIDLVFSFGTGVNQALSPVAESQGIPLLILSTDNASAGKKFVIRFSMHADKYALALLQYVREQGFKHLLVAKQEIAFFNEIVAGMKRHLNPDEMLSVENLLPEERDFRALLLRLKGIPSDAIGAFIVSGQAGHFLLQAKELQFQRPFFGANTFEGRDELRLSGGALVGAVYPSINFSNEFHQAYFKRFGNDTQIPFAALSHDFAVLLTKLPHYDQGRPAPQQLMRNLREIKSYDGACGRINYLESPEFGPAFDLPAALRRVEPQGFTTLFIVE